MITNVKRPSVERIISNTGLPLARASQLVELHILAHADVHITGICS